MSEIFPLEVINASGYCLLYSDSYNEDSLHLNQELSTTSDTVKKWQMK